MIRISILYPNTGWFDWDYYLTRHMPRSIALLSPALREVSVEQGVGGGGEGVPAPFIATCHLSFDSVDDFYSAFLPHAAELQGDMANYTDVEPLIQIGEVRIARI